MRKRSEQQQVCARERKWERRLGSVQWVQEGGHTQISVIEPWVLPEGRADDWNMPAVTSALSFFYVFTLPPLHFAV